MAIINIFPYLWKTTGKNTFLKMWKSKIKQLKLKD